MRGYAQTSAGQIHYRHEGESGPAIVFFHEAPLSSAIYAPALPLLGRSFRAYAFDTPGHGFSDPPLRPPTMQEYGATLAEAIDDIGLDRFVLAGCHTGVDIGLEVARHAGLHRVTHAILTGLPLLKPDEWEGWLKSVLGGAREGEDPASWRDVFAPDMNLTSDGAHVRWAWDRYGRIWAAGSPVELINMAVMQLLLAGPRYNWMYKAAFAYDPEPALRELTCPALLLNAAGDPLANKDAVAAGFMHDARVVHLEGVPGQLPWRVPERFTHEIEKFAGVGARAAVSS
ncbi:MAG TPA: alpha/beta hydrolase [Gaiellales bacterium]|nr:alpha/beta hydrolase [Gaiellales bacterium]